MQNKSTTLTIGLSKRQAEVLKFVTDFRKTRNYSPSLTEIAEYFEVSVPTIHQHISYLQQKGFIKTEKNKKRSINVQAGNVAIKRMIDVMDSFAIPILGAASAGPALMNAEESIEGYLKVPRHILNRQRKDGVFALRVEGDSMNKASISGNSFDEGDFVLIDSEYKNPQDGDYVLSTIDGHANLKKFRRNAKTNQITLESESTNPKHKPIFVSSDDHFIINGKIISVIKK